MLPFERCCHERVDTRGRTERTRRNLGSGQAVACACVGVSPVKQANCCCVVVPCAQRRFCAGIKGSPGGRSMWVTGGMQRYRSDSMMKNFILAMKRSLGWRSIRVEGWFGANVRTPGYRKRLSFLPSSRLHPHLHVGLAVSGAHIFDARPVESCVPLPQRDCGRFSRPFSHRMVFEKRTLHRQRVKCCWSMHAQHRRTPISGRQLVYHFAC